MRKILFITSAITIFVVLAMSVVFAQNTGPSGTSGGGSQPTQTLNVGAILGRIETWLFGLLLGLATIFIIVAAYHYLTAGGDAEKVKTATRMIWYTVAAVAVAALSRVIIAVVAYFLYGP